MFFQKNKDSRADSSDETLEYLSLSRGNADICTIREAVAKAELLMEEHETARKTVTHKAFLLITLALSMSGFLYSGLSDVKASFIGWADACEFAAFLVWAACAICAYQVPFIGQYGSRGLSPEIAKHYLVEEAKGGAGTKYTNEFLCYLLDEYAAGISRGRETLEKKVGQLKNAVYISWVAGILTLLAGMLNMRPIIVGVYQLLL